LKDYEQNTWFLHKTYVAPTLQNLIEGGMLLHPITFICLNYYPCICVNIVSGIRVSFRA